MDNHKKQVEDRKKNHDIFIRPFSTTQSAVGAPSHPETHEFKIAEYTDAAGASVLNWFGMSTEAFDQLQRLSKTGRVEEQLLPGTRGALDFLDIPFVTDVHTGDWKFHHECSLTIVPVGTAAPVGPTPLDRNSLARATLLGEDEETIAEERRKWEEEKKRLRDAEELAAYEAGCAAEDEIARLIEELGYDFTDPNHGWMPW